MIDGKTGLFLTKTQTLSLHDIEKNSLLFPVCTTKDMNSPSSGTKSST